MLENNEKSINELISYIVSFEASKSRPNIGAGTRGEGREFQNSLILIWKKLAENLMKQTDTPIEYLSHKTRVWAKIRYNERSVYLPVKYPIHKQVIRIEKHPQLTYLIPILRTSYTTSELVEANIGIHTVIKKYAPVTGPFAATNYPLIFENIKTIFDNTIILENNNKIIEKIFIECKTAKSSNNNKIDGNAHERLTFQMLQFLEIAKLHKKDFKCSLIVFSNDAMIRYKNKYHIMNLIHADRLSTCNDEFNMSYLVSKDDYHMFFENIKSWLKLGNKNI